MKLVRENKTNYFILFVAFILLVGISGAAELKHNSDLAQERVLELQKQGVIHKQPIEIKSAMEKESFRHKIVDLNEELDVSANLDSSTIICGKTPTGEIRLKDLGKDHKLRDLKIRYSDLRGLDGVDKGFVKVTHFNDAGLPDAVWIQAIRNDGGYCYFEDVPFSEIIIGGFIGTYTISGSVNYQTSTSFGLGTTFDADSVNYLGGYVYPWYSDTEEWTFNQTGLVAWYKFDEGTGTLVSDSSGNNDGTANGGMTWTEGRYGKAGSFDGVNDYVSIPKNSAINNLKNFTICAVVQKDATGDTTIYTKHYGTIYFHTEKLRMSITGSGGTGYARCANNFPLNEEKFVTVTYSDTGDRIPNIYINGIEQTYDATTAVNGELVSDLNDNAVIGASYLGTSGHINGKIDNVMIFNRVLSNTEIAQIYREMCPYNVPTDGLVGYWSFDEGTGTAVNDISGNGNTGTATGMTWTDGKYNGAGRFDGVDDYVDVPHSDDFNYSNFTWIVTASTVIGKDQMYISNGEYSLNGYELFVSSISNQITYRTYQAGTVQSTFWSTNSINLTQTNNLALKVENHVPTLYINGKVATKTETGTHLQPVEHTGVLRFGQRAGAGSVHLNGSIDNVMIYNRALSDTEIKQIYYDSIEDLQLKTNSNAEYTSEIDGYTEYLDIPYDDTDADITSITATVPESVVIGGVTVRDYRNTVTPFSLTAEVGYTENTTLIEETLTDDIYEIYIRYTPNNNYDAGSVSYVADANPILNSEYLEYTLTTNQAGSTLTYNSNTRKFTVNGVNFVEGQTYNYKITCALNPLIIPYLPPVDGFGDSRIEVDEATANETCMIGAVYDSESRNGMSIFGNWSTTLGLAILAPFIAAAVLIVLLLRKVI